MTQSTNAADLARIVKSSSTKWVHDTFPQMGYFAWQAGYGAFSVSYSEISGVKRYIANQEEHHRTMTFQDEFRAFLRKHDLEWDEKYLWD